MKTLLGVLCCGIAALAIGADLMQIEIRGMRQEIDGMKAMQARQTEAIVANSQSALLQSKQRELEENIASLHLKHSN